MNCYDYELLPIKDGNSAAMNQLRKNWPNTLQQYWQSCRAILRLWITTFSKILDVTWLYKNRYNWASLLFLKNCSTVSLKNHFSSQSFQSLQCLGPQNRVNKLLARQISFPVGSFLAEVNMTRVVGIKLQCTVDGTNLVYNHKLVRVTAGSVSNFFIKPIKLTSCYNIVFSLNWAFCPCTLHNVITWLCEYIAENSFNSKQYIQSENVIREEYFICKHIAVH